MRRREFLIAPFIALSSVSFGQAQVRTPRLGILSPSFKGGDHDLVYPAFTTALAELGWSAGGNIDIIERFAEDDHERLPALAAELLAFAPDVIFTNTTTAAHALSKATATIPIVVGPASESTFIEFAGNFARPTRNVTGFTLHSPGQDEKCLELLKEASPRIVRVGVLVNPLNPVLREAAVYLHRAALALGLTLVPMEARGADEIDAAFETAGGIDGLHVPDDANLAGRVRSRRRIIELTALKSIPVVSSHVLFARDGALLTLGTDISALARRAAGYVDRILRGAKPGDLPVERPTIFKLVVNLTAARALGLSMPSAVVARADEVIE